MFSPCSALAFVLWLVNGVVRRDVDKPCMLETRCRQTMYARDEMSTNHVCSRRDVDKPCMLETRCRQNLGVWSIGGQANRIRGFVKPRPYLQNPLSPAPCAFSDEMSTNFVDKTVTISTVWQRSFKAPPLAPLVTRCRQDVDRVDRVVDY